MVLLEVARRPTPKGFDLWPITEFVQTYGRADRRQQPRRYRDPGFQAGEWAPSRRRDPSVRVHARLDIRVQAEVVVDYIVHFVRASGGHGVKVFKLKTFDLPGRAEVVLRKAHSLKPITTRTYYPGEHRLQIQVNGTVKHETTWRLKRPRS